MWSPALARIYGIRPWELVLLTDAEWNALGEDVKALAAASK